MNRIGHVTQIRDAPSYQDRMITAVEWWLAWCAGHHADALEPTSGLVHQAAIDLRRIGASDQQLLDLVEQVGHMADLQGAPGGVDLHRTV